MKETVAFVDEGFLSRLSKYFGGEKYMRFDKIQFIREIAKTKELFVKHIFYATSPPFQETPPTEDQRRRKEGYDKFKSKFSNVKDFTFLEGRCQRIKDGNGNFKYRQKGVDTVLTMVLSSFIMDFPTIKEIILVACDSDFAPVIKMLEHKGIKVILFSYYKRERNTEFSRSHHLIDACSEYVQLKKEDFIKVELK